MSDYWGSTKLFDRITLVEKIFRRIIEMLKDFKTLQLETLIPSEYRYLDFHRIGAIVDYFRKLCMLLETWSEADYWRKLIGAKIDEINRMYREYEISSREWVKKRDELDEDVDRLGELLETILKIREALCGERVMKGIPIYRLIEQLKSLLPQQPPQRPPPEPKKEFGILDLISTGQYEHGIVEKFIAKHKAGLIVFDKNIKKRCNTND